MVNAGLLPWAIVDDYKIGWWTDTFDNVELAAAKDIGREPVQYVANIYKYYLAYRMSSEQVMRRKTAREAAGIN